MARMVIVAIVVIAVIGMLIYFGTQAVIKKARQKQLAHYAPELLKYSDVPAPIAEYVVAQSQALASAADIMERVMDDNSQMLDADHAFSIDGWLRQHRSNKRRHLQ